jgi:hypothetical protein
VGVIETTVGVIVGALVTVLASRYYFRRSISKRLSVYRLLNSFVFGGISLDVRKELQFRFQNRVVDEVQQVIFLVANDGERAIRDVIESLTLTIPSTVEILDASVVYRQPEGLKVAIVAAPDPPRGNDLRLDFPLLNKREFFVVKLLLSGRFHFSSLNILCDDLPRVINVELLPPDAVKDSEYKFEWVPALIGFAFLLLAAWPCYSSYLLHSVHPELFHPILFPRPRAISLVPEAWFYLVFGGIITLSFLGIGLLLLSLAIFGGEFPPSRGPRFRLSKELQGMVFPYRGLHLPANIAEVNGSGPDEGADRQGS